MHQQQGLSKVGLRAVGWDDDFMFIYHVEFVYHRNGFEARVCMCVYMWNEQKPI